MFIFCRIAYPFFFVAENNRANFGSFGILKKSTSILWQESLPVLLRNMTAFFNMSLQTTGCLPIPDKSGQAVTAKAQTRDSCSLIVKNNLLYFDAPLNQ